jgi:hypothetical protein
LSVEEADKIDMIAYEKAGDEVFLVITDHLDWVAGDSGRRER